VKHGVILYNLEMRTVNGLLKGFCYLEQDERRRYMPIMCMSVFSLTKGTESAKTRHEG
jgi:hypothetical protein